MHSRSRGLPLRGTANPETSNMAGYEAGVPPPSLLVRSARGKSRDKNANYSHGEYRHCTAVTSSLTTGPGGGSAAGAGGGEGTASAASTGRGEGTRSAASKGCGEGTGSAASKGCGEGTGSAASKGCGEGTRSAASKGCGEGTGSAASTVRRECTGTAPNVQQWFVPSQIRCALGNLARAWLSVMQAGEP
jgi:hypothetical protein